MTYEFYKVLHLLGIFLIVVPLGGVAMHVLNGGSRESNSRGRAIAGMLHGLGLLIVFVAGFGLLARLEIGFPIWVWLKLALWLVFGVYTMFLYRRPRHALPLLLLIPVLATVSGYLAVYKPF